MAGDHWVLEPNLYEVFGNRLLTIEFVQGRVIRGGLLKL
jgi:hypothetical protein